MYLLISVYNESINRDRDGAEMLRPEPFVAVCEHTSIHDDILSKGCRKINEGLLLISPITIFYKRCFLHLFTLCSQCSFNFNMGRIAFISAFGFVVSGRLVLLQEICWFPYSCEISSVFFCKASESER